jgi:hypothetical protein
MKSQLLKRAALLAGLAGFVWSFVAIDPVVRSGHNVADLADSDSKSPHDSDHYCAGNLNLRRQ